MQKRGISHHLDWIIGITLFMFFVVFVIATIKPGVQPLHKKDVLLDIVQDKFIENVTWEIQRVPLLIDAHCTSPVTTSYVSIAFPFAWENDKTRIYDKDNNEIDFGISGSLVIYYGNSALGKKNYLILHSNDPNFNGVGGTLSTGCNADVEHIYGVPELLTGLSEDKINILETYIDTLGYEQLKTDWKYPITSDFNITVDLNGHIFEISSGKPPASNANVYVKQYTDFILDEKGVKISALATIKVW